MTALLLMTKEHVVPSSSSLSSLPSTRHSVILYYTTLQTTLRGHSEVRTHQLTNSPTTPFSGFWFPGREIGSWIRSRMRGSGIAVCYDGAGWVRVGRWVDRFLVIKSGQASWSERASERERERLSTSRVECRVSSVRTGVVETRSGGEVR